MTQGPNSVAAFRTGSAESPAEAARACAERSCGDARPSSILIATINPAIGDTGVQTHTRSLHEGLSAAGICSSVQTPFSRRAWWLPIFGLRKLFGPLNRSWSTRWYRHWHGVSLRNALIRRLEKEGPSAILAQCPVSANAALEARDQLGMKFPIAMVCHFNFSEAKEYRDKGELSDEKSYRGVLDFEERVISAVDRVIYVSGWARRVVEDERGIKIRRSSIIWNGIASTPGDARVSRAELGLSDNDLVLINVGTLERRKNQAGLVDLFAALVKDRPEARLVLVGDGPQRAAVHRRIDEHGIADKVRLLGMRRDVPAILPTADLYVHYAGLENCPVVLIEAARAALPIAAIPSGGVPELLAALQGIALHPTDVAASSAILRPMLADADLRHQSGLASREAFEKSFTREAMVASYLNALDITHGHNPEPRTQGTPGVSGFQEPRTQGTPGVSGFQEPRTQGTPEVSGFQEPRTQGTPGVSGFQEPRTQGTPEVSGFELPMLAPQEE